MKCGVLYFDGFCEFEVIIAIGNLAQKGEIVGVALEDRPYLSEEKQTFLPNALVSETDASDLDVFLIPGGDVKPLLEKIELRKLITELNLQGKIIGAICGGVLLLGKLGILDRKRFTGAARGYEFDADTLESFFPSSTYTGEDVVKDGNVVTAMGQAFVEFGVEVADRAGIYASNEEKRRDYCWIKNRVEENGT